MERDGGEGTMLWIRGIFDTSSARRGEGKKKIGSGRSLKRRGQTVKGSAEGHSWDLRGESPEGDIPREEVLEELARGDGRRHNSQREAKESAKFGGIGISSRAECT